MAMIIAILALGLVTAGLAATAYQLMRQQGRLLLRLDHVERLLGIPPGEGIGQGLGEIGSLEEDGLAVGSVLPGFELPDVEGRKVSSEDFRGRGVLLVHWSAACGYCAQIAPDLAALQEDLERAGVQLLLVSGGMGASEREMALDHGLRCPVLLLEDGGIPAFHQMGTPAAYLLDGEGKVVEPLAIGADQVPELARRAAGDRGGGDTAAKRGRRPLSQSRIERNGLKPGTPAPAFELPEVRGGMVSLAAHRGRKVLLVFSDPHCGPCDELAPHLLRLHEEHRQNGLDLLMVGRGDPEENRRKAEERGFRFPVALQRKWEVSRQYGIFAAPVGFLIDENGVIAEEVGLGIDQIVALADQAGAGKDVSNGQAV